MKTKKFNIPEKHIIPFLRELCDKSFYHFVKIIGGSVGQGGIISPIIHKPLCKFFQRQDIKRRSIFMPRNWLKSTCYTQWGTIWNYLQNNDTRTLIASQNEDIAKRFLHFIKYQILNNPLLRTVYPELQAVDRTYTKHHRWSQSMIDLPRMTAYKESSITSIGVGGAAQSGHYDNVFIDDPVGQKHVDSPPELDRVFRWFDNAKELLDNPNYMENEASVIQLICTFWSAGDFGCYVLENYPEYKWRIVPALKDEAVEDSDTIKWIQNPKVEHWHSNWENAPKGKSKTEYYLDMLRHPEQELVFWYQHMNNYKRATGLNKFDAQWFKYFRFEEREQGTFVVCKDDNEAFKLSSIPKRGVLDPGGFSETKQLKRGSRNAIIIAGQPHGTIKKFITYAWAGRLESPEKYVDEIIKADKSQHPLVWRIETYAQQEYIRKDIMESASKRGYRLVPTPLPHMMGADAKDHRIQQLVNPFFNGEFYIHEQFKDLITELQQYPIGFTNDLIDAVGWWYHEYGSRRARPKPPIPRRMSIEKMESGRNPVTGY